MKKIILLVLLFISFQICYGQISFGVRTGGNLSDQKFKDTDYGNYDNATGMYGGIFAQTRSLSKSFLRAELNYT